MPSDYGDLSHLALEADLDAGELRARLGKMSDRQLREFSRAAGVHVHPRREPGASAAPGVRQLSVPVDGATAARPSRGKDPAAHDAGRTHPFFLANLWHPIGISQRAVHAILVENAGRDAINLERRYGRVHHIRQTPLRDSVRAVKRQ